MARRRATSEIQGFKTGGNLQGSAKNKCQTVTYKHKYAAANFCVIYGICLSPAYLSDHSTFPFLL